MKGFEQLQRQEKFYSSLTGREIGNKEYEHDIKVSIGILKVGMQCSIWQRLSLNLFQILTFIFFFQNGMRGIVSYIYKRCRVSCIYKRCSKANNKYLKSFDPNQKSKHILNLDTNNL